MVERVLRRARQSSEKLERRCQILGAAELLFAQGEGELPTVQAIADRAGLAKGTVYLYFTTLEEIFLSLLGEHMVKWMSEAQEKLRRLKPPITPDKVAATMNAYPVSHPVVMRLASVAAFQIARPGMEEAYFAFKRQCSNNLTQFGAFLEENLTGLEKGRGAAAVLKGVAITFGLWQMANPSLDSLTLRQPEVLRLDFARELPCMLRSHWRGEVSYTELR